MNVPIVLRLGYAGDLFASKVTGVDMEHISDHELARLAVKDAEAFEEVVRRHYTDVYRICAYFTHDREEAWDLSQDTFINAHRAIGSFRGDASLKTWLLRIASNRAKDYLKKKRLRTVPLEGGHAERIGKSDPDPGDLARGEEIGRALEAALQMLSPAHRLAITLREYEGLSYEEMAKIMKCRVGTVMSRLHHARKYLREHLEALGHGKGTAR